MKRTLLLGTAWTASAASAVGLGFLAVSLVDASASRGTVPLAAASPATSSGSATETPSMPATATQTRYTVAGTVTADCTSGKPRLAGAPATDWWVDDSRDPGELEFEDGNRKLEVTVTCVDGSPVFAMDDRDDDSRGDDDRPSSPPASTDAPDDSDGRVGGGHGSDDPAGDDSAGRTGGGHGSDDSGSDDSRSDDSGKGSDDSGKGSDDSGSDDSGGHGGDDRDDDRDDDKGGDKGGDEGDDD